MNLHFGNIILRAIEEKDAALLKLLMNSSEVEAMTVGWNPPVSDFAQAEWIKNFRCSDKQIRWMMELNDGTTIGMIVLSDIDWKNRTAFVHYKINPFEKNRQRGDTKNALYAVLKYAFDELGFHRIEGSILDYNTFSRKLILSLGFVKEGTYRKKTFKNGTWHDEDSFGLLNEEFIRYYDNEAPWQKRDAAKSKLDL